MVARKVMLKKGGEQGGHLGTMGKQEEIKNDYSK